MTYQRMRARNHILKRKPSGDRDPYWRDGSRFPGPSDLGVLIGDLNRMEQDYLDPPFEWTDGAGSPAERCATETGVDVETVRKVLRYVFMEQR